MPDGKLKTYSNLRRRAIMPAVEEINAMAAFGCQVDPVKHGQKVTHIRVFWWKKDIEALKAAYAELQQPKVGRRARTRGVTEAIVEPTLFDE